MAEKSPGFDLRRLSSGTKLAAAVILVSLAMKFPNASAIFKVYDKSLLSYDSLDIPYYRWHRFRSEEQAYYSGLASLICDSRSDILNLTMDSSIPYLCPGQKNVMPLPFFSAPMLASISPELAERVERGEFYRTELVVSDAVPASSGPRKLTEVGRVNRPPSMRFMHYPAQVAVYAVESRK
jgi:hypothetical protein